MGNTRLKKLITNLKQTYQKVPYSFCWLFYLIKLPYRLIRRLDYKLRVNVWIISGKEPQKSSIRILFAGNEKNKNYIRNLIFDNPYTETYLGKTWRRNLTRRINKRSQDCCLMILEVNNASHRSFDTKRGFFTVPCWIGQQADISIDATKLIKYEKQMSKYDLQFEVTNEQYQFDTFYNTMHLPYISKVHGNKAFLMSYDEMKKNLKRCDLLLIKKGNEYIGGNLIIYEKDTPRLWSLGVKDGNTDYLKIGVTVAIDYFAIKYLKQKGYKKLHFGLTRAFLNDGVLQYKKRWGLQIVGHSEMGFLIKPLIKSTEVKEFFLKNPFIYLEDNRLNGAVFIHNEQLHSREDFEKIYKTYYLKGLFQFSMYYFGNNQKDLKEIISPELSEKISIYSAENLFQK